MSKATPGATDLDLSALNGSQSTKAVLTSKRGISTSIVESLGGITIGILVLAAIGVGVGAAYNIGQDSSAKATIDSVAPAQTIVQNRTGAFGTLAQLTEGEDPAMTGTPDNMKINASDTNYCATITSNSMFAKTYWLTAKSGKILDTKPADALCTFP